MLERRIRRELGEAAEGKLVAMDRRTGDHVVADDLDALLAAIVRAGMLAGARLHIFRVGGRAAIELRRR
jgi:hypothetical protein